MLKNIPILLLTFSLAQAEPSLVVSESALANLIHSQNPELKAARWKIQEAVGKWQQAGRPSRPKLDVELEHDAAFTEGELRLGLSRSFPLTNKLTLEKEISKAKLDAAEWEILQAERELLRDARLLFTKALALKGRKQSLIAEEKEALGFAQLIAERQKNAEASALETIQAKLDAAAMTIEQKQIEAEESVVLTDLKKMLGMNPHNQISLNGSLRSPSPPPAGNPNKRADYKSALFQIDRARSMVEHEKANRLDDLEAGVFVSGMRREDAPDGFEKDLMVGFELSIPLPFWDDNSGNIAAAQATMKRREQEASNILQNARHDAAGANDEMQQWRTLDQQIQRELLPLAQQQLDLAQQAYQQGQGDLTEIFRARAQKRQLTRASIDALSSYHQARIRYEAALPKN